MSKRQYKNWCFTLNNYTDEQHGTLMLGIKEFSYVITGMETGEKGTDHLQGYFELKKKITLSGLKKLLTSYGLKGAHLEPRMGTQEEAIVYCQKDGHWAENGTRSKQGARTDLDLYRRMAGESGMREVSKWGNLQSIKTAEVYLKYNDKPRYCPDEMKVIYIYGPSGTGKTTEAYKRLGIDDTYVWDCATMGQWWEGYDGEKNVIMDDLSPDTVPPKALLAYLGGFPVRAPCKGGSRQLQATTIVITTLVSPKEFWKNNSLRGESFMQFERRITEVIYLDKTYGRAAEIEAQRKKDRGSKKSLLATGVNPMDEPHKNGSQKSRVILGEQVPDPGPPSEDVSDSINDGSFDDGASDFESSSA